MIHTITILDEPLDVEFDFAINNPENVKEKIQMTFSVSDIRLLDYNHAKMEVPGWLRELIEEELLDSDDVYNKIVEEGR